MSMSEESKKKAAQRMSEMMKKRWIEKREEMVRYAVEGGKAKKSDYTWSEEAKQNHVGFTGSKHSSEAKKKIGVGASKNWTDEEYRKKTIHYGPHDWSEETKQRMRDKIKKLRAENPELYREIARKGGRATKGKKKIITTAVLDGRESAREKLKLYRGPLASNWQGGKSFEEYGEYWTKEFREMIRKRERYECNYCGIKEEELTGFSKKLDVDHIDGDKKNSDPRNFQLLCRNCHMLKSRYQNEPDFDGCPWHFKRYVQQKQAFTESN